MREKRILAIFDETMIRVRDFYRTKWESEEAAELRRQQIRLNFLLRMNILLRVSTLAERTKHLKRKKVV